MVGFLRNNYKITEFMARSGRPCVLATFSCRGGKSKGLFKSLNVGKSVGDEQLAVDANRQLVKEAIGIPNILSAKQVHGDKVYCLTTPLTGDEEVEEVDALVTDEPGVGLMIQQADCQSVLLFDAVKEAIAAVHCGWRGSVQQILQRTVAIMAERYGTLPADLQALISPSLGPCCAEFVNYKEELPTGFQRFMVKENYFDFWQISKSQLVSAGLSEPNIHTAGVCTCCTDDYFSYRRATRSSGGVTGRNCSVIALRNG